MDIKNPTVIYDLGANNGDDVVYYLKKADVVVAVEANPVLCDQMASRFSTEIAGGRLFVERCVLAEDDHGHPVSFYIHTRDSALSQLPEPAPAQRGDFQQVLLPSLSIAALFNKYGAPHYVKSDLEGYDEVFLRRMFSLGIFPPYVSVEAHSFEVFSLLVAVGGYNAFKLLSFDEFFRTDRTLNISVGQGTERYSFPAQHSSGPFGDDIPGGWMTTNNFTLLLGLEAPGWKDIHASRVATPDPALKARLATYVIRAVKGKCAGMLERLHLKKRKKYTFAAVEGAQSR
jgi:FkbM family methyltransferase